MSAGPFFFAWVDETDTSFISAYEREDVSVYSFELSHQEGEFPSLTVDTKNPNVGLLSAGRKQWAWFAYKKQNGTVVPLFFGRLLGLPEAPAEDVIRMTFVARPKDWDAQRQALADTLKVRPYWDPVWYNQDARDNPDTVLEGYNRLWHVDRVTHVVTASGINEGEDGTTDFGGSIDRDTLSLSLGTTPARRVEITGEVSWQQRGVGTVDLTRALIDAFRSAGTASDYLITTYTGEGLMRDWPDEGKRIGSGWTVGETSVERVDGRVNKQGYQEVQTENGSLVSFPLWTLKASFKVDYDAKRTKTETVTMTLEADVQAILADPGDEEVIQLALQSSELNEYIDPGDTANPDGLMPIGVETRRSYFQTTRGWDSIGHLICRARAALLARARTAKVAFSASFEDGLDLSCRKSATVTDDRLPGGTATGKVTAYSLIADGSTGRIDCAVEIGCTIGQGNTVSADAGTPDYVDDAYVEDGYQTRSGQVELPVADVTFVPPQGVDIEDDGVDFDNMTPDRVLKRIDASYSSEYPGMYVEFGQSAQQAILNQGGSDAEAITAALNQGYTEVELNLVPLARGPFEQTYEVTVSDLMIPKTIDLEAT